MSIDAIFRKIFALGTKLFPLRNDGCLAEPWRRLLAATLDSALLLTASCLFYFAGVIKCISADEMYRIYAIGVPFVLWGYVLLGWASGATIGMRMCNIRLVTERFEPLSVMIAIKRMVGFWLACLPVKIGLLPILFDERRQGWHDRLAGTLVVKSQGISKAIPDRLEREELPVLSAPDFSVPLKYWPLPLIAYAALCIAITWPVAAHLSTRLAGGGGDSYLFLWNYWYFAYALSHHLSPIYTNYVYFPKTVSLGLHTMQWFNCILALGLTPFLNQTAVYNVLNFISLTLSAYGGYWMAAAMSKSRRAGFAIGIATGFSAYLTSHDLGHANLIAIEFIPLFIVCLFAAYITLEYRYALWAGLWMALAGLCDTQYAAFCGLVGIVMLAGLWLYTRREGVELIGRRVVLLGVAVSVSALLMLPIVIAAIRDMGGSNEDKSGVAGAFRMDAVAWFKPGMGSYFWGNQRFEAKDIESYGSPGMLLLAFAIVGLIRHWRTLRLWAFITLCFTILASGPFLTINGNGANFAVWTIVGFPGTDFGLPSDTINLFNRTREIAAQDGKIFNSEDQIAMPYAWLPKIVPLLKPFRVPARFAVIVLLAIGVLGAYGIVDAITWASAKKRGAGLFAATMISVCLIIEYWVAPYRTVATISMPGYVALGGVHGEGAMIEIPLRGDVLTAYGQTLHHKKVFRSFTSRMPQGAFDISEHNAFLASALYSTTPEDTIAFREAFNECYVMGARFVALNMPEATAGGWETLLEKRYGLVVIYADDHQRIYRIDHMIPIR